MASNVLAGFIKGVADYGADAIKRREEMDRELAKTKLLAQLQMETEKEMETFKDQLAAKRADKDFSSADYTNGKFVIRNREGQEIGSRDLTEDEKQAHKLALDKTATDIESTKADIGYKNTLAANSGRQLDIEAQNAATSRMRANTDAAQFDYIKKKDGLTTLDGKPVAKAEYNQTISELTKAGANPRKLATFQTAWQNGLDQGWSLKDQKEFLRRTRQLWTDGATTKDGKKITPLLDKFSTLRLDKAIEDNSASD